MSYYKWKKDWALVLSYLPDEPDYELPEHILWLELDNAIGRLSNLLFTTLSTAEGRKQGKYRLVYNKATKKIDKVSNVDGLVAESFDPPHDCDSCIGKR
jgi:hypothetical protein